MQCKLIAEIGWNFCGNMELAKDMVSAAFESGANYAKFQTWKVDRLIPGPWDTDGRREIYEKAELTEERHELLKEHCDKVGIKFLTSCFCVEDIDMIRKFTNEIKIPSPEAYDVSLIKAALEKFDKVYLSTGASHREEYSHWARYDKVTLFHCVSSYPCEDISVNFSKMRYLQSLTKNVGYSGHLVGVHDAFMAICYGATVVEKHFTTDHNLPGRDNKFALLPEEFKQIRDFIYSHRVMNEDCGLEIQNCEMDYRKHQKGRWG
jgi:N,N'-diacetyllegionaminate synthase